MGNENLLNLLKENLKLILENLSQKNFDTVFLLLDENGKIVEDLEKKGFKTLNSLVVQECIVLQNLVDIELKKEALELKNEIHILEFKKLRISKLKQSDN